MSYKLSTNPTRVKVQMSQESFDDLTRFADRLGVPLARIARVGTLRLITEIEKGEYMTDVLPEYKTGIRPGCA